ncbi:MAG: NAD(P)/FAD-dependent oxidoreductase [Pseudomonadota bacterium]
MSLERPHIAALRDLAAAKDRGQLAQQTLLDWCVFAGLCRQTLTPPEAEALLSNRADPNFDLSPHIGDRADFDDIPLEHVKAAFAQTLDLLERTDTRWTSRNRDVIRREAYKAFEFTQRAGLYGETEIPAKEPAAHTSAEETTPVLIIGAGFGGMSMALQLQKDGVPFLIIDAGEGFGGCWRSSSYPGARVDVASSLYSFATAGVTVGNEIYAPGDVLLDYFNTIARKHDLEHVTRFGERVVRCERRDAGAAWTCSITRKDGSTYELNAANVVFATGQLSKPLTPNIEGLDTFSGQAAHSGDWPRMDLSADDRVAIVGGAASAIQLAIEIAPHVAQLDIYAPSRNWFYRVPHYRQPVRDLTHICLTRTPFIYAFFRLEAFIPSDLGNLHGVETDASGEPTSTALAFKDNLAAGLKAMGLEDYLPDDLPGQKRVLVDDGSWGALLTRDNVQLIEERVRSIRGDLIVSETTEREADKLILCTGYVTDDFTGGCDVVDHAQGALSAYWGDKPWAYGGVSVPGWSGVYFMYGPNSNGVVNGNILWFLERQAETISAACAARLKGETPKIEALAKEYGDAYQALVDAGNARRTWGRDGVKSWYRNAAGHCVQNWPFTLGDYDRCLEDFAAFERNAALEISHDDH